MTKQEIKKAIEDLEWRNNSAGGRMCGIDIQVRNLKVLKNKAVADIIITEDGQPTYRENRVEYSYDLLF